jgi:flagellar hook assembly protein FlgD
MAFGSFTVTVTPPTINDFTASASVYQINVSLGETVAFTSNVPVSLTETLTIQSVANGATVRTLLNNVSRGAGTYQDTWNGTNDAGQPVADGPYKYVAVVTANGSSFTWDDTTHYIGTMDTQFNYPKCRNSSNAIVACNDASITFDPYTNKPLRVVYCVGGGDPTDGSPCTGSGTLPAVVIAKASNSSETDASCSGSNCLLNESQATGLHEIPWYGGSIDGTFLGGTSGITVIRRNVAWARDTMLIYGTAPVVSRFAISWTIFNPAAATDKESGETFSMNAATFQSHAVIGKAVLKNLASGSILRTVTTAAQPAGTVQITWDGRADNGAWVAPGLYEATVTITDAITGSVTTLKPLVTVRYE